MIDWVRSKGENPTFHARAPGGRIDLRCAPLDRVRFSSQVEDVDLSFASLSRACFASGLASTTAIGATLRHSTIAKRVTDVDLSEADLRRANLQDTFLHKAKLARADLRGAALTTATLTGQVDLNHADLRNADLSNARLHDVDLTGADLRGADMRNARLEGVRLDGAVYSARYVLGWIFVGTRWPPTFDLTNKGLGLRRE